MNPRDREMQAEGILRKKNESYIKKETGRGNHVDRTRKKNES